MALQRIGVMAILSLGLMTVGCGYDCEDFCEDAADCSGSEQDPDDCDSDCEDAEELNDASGCDDEWDDLMDCASEVDDICDDDEAEKCQSEADDYLTCVLSWCSRHSSANECS